MELLNPARVNHMPSTGESTPQPCWTLDAPKGVSGAPLSWGSVERKGWGLRSKEVACSFLG